MRSCPGFRHNPQFVTVREKQESALRARVLDCDDHQSLDQPFQNKLFGHGVRRLHDGSKIEFRYGSGHV